MTFVSQSWLVWTVLTVVMLLAFGPRHPRTVDEDVPLDRGRMWLAFFALVMFVVGAFVPFFNLIDVLWLLWDKPYRQCLHDKFAKTVVVKGVA